MQQIQDFVQVSQHSPALAVAVGIFGLVILSTLLAALLTLAGTK